MTISTTKPKQREMTRAEVETIVDLLKRSKFKTRYGAAAWVAKQVDRSPNLVFKIAQGKHYTQWSGGKVPMPCDATSPAPGVKLNPLECRDNWFNGSPVSLLLSTRRWTPAGLRGLKAALKQERPL